MSILYETVSRIWSFFLFYFYLKKKKVKKIFFPSCFFWCSDHFDNSVSPTLPKEESKKCLLYIGNGPRGVLILSFPRKGGTENRRVLMYQALNYFQRILQERDERLSSSATGESAVHC